MRMSNVRSGAQPKQGWAIRGSSNLRRRQRIRAGLWFLAAGQAITGIWALAAPRSFYDDFPGAGLDWVVAIPKYSEHLVRDVARQPGLRGLVPVGGFESREERGQGRARRLARVRHPHLIFHIFNLDALSSTSRVVQLIALGITVLVPIVLLMSVQKLDQRRGPVVLR